MTRESRIAGTTRSCGVSIAAITLIFGCILRPALAHPHILIAAHTEIAVNQQGELTNISNIWDFDEAFSAFAVQGYDTNGDGILTRQELQPFAEVNMKSLADYGYFTRVTLDGASIAFARPKDYFDVFNDEKLTLHFTLPLVKPLLVRGKTFEVDVYDPEYFAAITFAPGQPVRLVGTSTGCESLVHRPGALDPATASLLATIPANQRKLPPELSAVTNKLINGVRVTCK